MQYLRRESPLLGRLVRLPYRIVVCSIVGVDLPPTLTIGPRVRLFHPHNIVIHPNAVIGSDALIRHGLTIDAKLLTDGSESRAPVLHDDVELGASCILIGDIVISSHCVIGAGAVVTKSLPEGSVAIGNPFRIV